ncbi:MAG: hypothetical protein R3F61_21780 [Myxococcota bacterium]
MHASQLPIEEPCSVDWTGMSGDERRRFCGQCSKHVHHLSALTEAQAAEVVAQPDVCVRYEVDRSGDIVFRPRRSARMLLLAAAVVSTPAFAGGQAASDPSLLDRIVGWVSDRLGLSADETPSDVIPEVTTPSVEPVDTGIVPDENPERHHRMGKIALRQPDAFETDGGASEPAR